MFRKFQIFLIRMIAAGRPVMLNVHVSDMGITVLGDGAHIEGNTIENAPDHALRVIGSKQPRFSTGSKPDAAAPQQTI